MSKKKIIIRTQLLEDLCVYLRTESRGKKSSSRGWWAKVVAQKALFQSLCLEHECSGLLIGFLWQKSPVGQGRWGIAAVNTGIQVFLLQDLSETLISHSWALHLHCALRREAKGMWGSVSVG